MNEMQIFTYNSADVWTVIKDGEPWWVAKEAGLYNIVMSCRNPEAKKFKRWVTHEVLPSIRKHGAYMTARTIDDLIMNPVSIIKLATALKEERKRANALTAQIERDKPGALTLQNWIENGKSRAFARLPRPAKGKSYFVWPAKGKVALCCIP